MNETHPLKRKSIKPSSSTVRGMLPSNQCKDLDAAMQSVRSAGLQLEWTWKSKSVGWICSGFYEGELRCELIPTSTPLLGRLVLLKFEMPLAEASESIPEKYKNILRNPIKETKDKFFYEFDLDSTPMRDLFSNVLEALEVGVFDKL